LPRRPSSFTQAYFNSLLGLMRTFCAQQWRVIAVLVLSIVWIAVFPIWSRWVSTDPLNSAISLLPPGAIEENIDVKLPEGYSLHLMFTRNGIPFERLRSTIGAMGVCKIGEQCPKGVPVPIRWSLKSIETGELASSGEVESIDSSGWSAAHVYRNLGTVKVQPGRYAFRAEVLRPVPELANMRTQIAIQLKPKATTTWQMGLVWWGAIGQYLLAWPLVAYAGVLLVWRAGLTLLSSGTPANGPLLDKLRKDATRESDPELRRQRLAKVDEIESAVHDVINAWLL
jgi:hypothetical protein